jgi:hypothetical protein
MTADECYKPPPPELTTDDGIFCGNYGRPSPNNQIRLYNKSECDKLNGNYIPNGECLIKTGGSYSAACSTLNTPAALPNFTPAKCDPDAKGNLSRECLISLAKGLGFNESGGMLRILMGSMAPNQTDKYAFEVLRGKGIAIPDAVLGAGNIDKMSAATIYSDLYNAMTSGYENLTKQAAKWLVSGSDSFDICDFEANKTGPFSITCLQREFRQAGCQPAGAQHPTAANSGPLQGLTWAGVGKKFQNLYASMSSTDSETQRKATHDCLGIKFYKAPDRECCYIMYGPWMMTGKSEQTQKLQDGKLVYMKYEAPYTKMVHQSGEGRYYVGSMGQFRAEKWSTYTLTPRGMYNVRKGSDKECEIA